VCNRNLQGSHPTNPYYRHPSLSSLPHPAPPPPLHNATQRNMPSVGQVLRIALSLFLVVGLPLLLSLRELGAEVEAANPVSFCKCTCGANVTIFPLDGPGGEESVDEQDACISCTKAFCLAKMAKFCGGVGGGGKGSGSGELLAVCFRT
jgi:hypothetical protein